MISPLDFFGLASLMALTSLALAVLIGFVGYYIAVPILSKLHGHDDEARGELSELVAPLALSVAPPNVTVTIMSPVIKELGLLSEMQFSVYVWNVAVVVLFYAASWSRRRYDNKDTDVESMRERRETIRKRLKAEKVPEDEIKTPNWRDERGEDS